MGGADEGAGDLLELLGTTESFALLHRAQDPQRVGILLGRPAYAERLADLPSSAFSTALSKGPRHDVLALIPYRQIRERGFACRDDGEPIRAIVVTDQLSAPTADILDLLPDMPVHLRDERFDIGDEEYAGIVREVQAREIGSGQGSNFVIHRSFLATIEDYSPAMALAAFRRLLAGESGAYWTFVIHTGGRTLVGASPERHVSLHDRTVEMNPISGTQRYPESGPSVGRTLEFLADRKEADELYMVVDEELKMMAGICDREVRLHGPRLREMTRLAHTEYQLSGHSTAPVDDVLRATMFAPTVTGSPLENACRAIGRYEPFGRGYYSGVAALIGTDAAGEPTVDSSILIRSADIRADGRLRIGVGATLVRHSEPRAEVAETKAKAAALLDAFHGDGRAPANGSRPRRRVGDDPAVRDALRARNDTLARFWLDGGPSGCETEPDLAGRSVLIVDAEDTFTAMLGHQLRTLGLEVTIRRYDEPFEPGEFDLVVVGPGPGDPCDSSPKTVTIRRLVERLLRRQPFLAVCFGHQVLSRVLGLEVVCRDVPNQGLQHEIDLFGRRTTVGFYNTFAARTRLDRFTSPAAGGEVEVCRDPGTGEVHALRGPGFRSVQFHVESVLTTDGVAILGELLGSLGRPTEECSHANR